MSENVLRVILSDSDERYRKMIKSFFLTMQNVEIISEVNNCAELMKLSHVCYCDYILTEITEPIDQCSNLINKIHSKCYDVKIIALMNLDWEEYIGTVLKDGVKDIILRQKEFEEVCTALRNIIDRKHYSCEEITNYLINNTIRNNYAKLLTKREREVLNKIALGMSTIDIANILSISIKTAGTHKTKLHNKTNTKNDVELQKPNKLTTSGQSKLTTSKLLFFLKSSLI